MKLILIAVLLMSACCTGRAAMPHQREALRWPKFETYECSDGQRRLLLERSSARLTRVGIVVRAPGLYAGIAGDLAWLATRYALAGTLRHTKAELDEAQNEFGSLIVTQMFGNSVIMWLDVLPEDSDRAAALLLEVVREPRLDPEVFDGLTGRLSKRQERTRQSSSSMAYRMAASALSGQQMPFATPSREEVVAFIKTNWIPNNISLVQLGQHVRLDAECTAPKGALIESTPERVALSRTSGVRKAIVVQSPSNTESAYVLMLIRPQHGLPAADADLFSQAYSGNPGSALFKKVRRERSYSYGIWSVTERVGTADYWLKVDGEIKPEQIDLALKDMFTVMHDLATSDNSSRAARAYSSLLWQHSSMLDNDTAFSQELADSLLWGVMPGSTPLPADDARHVRDIARTFYDGDIVVVIAGQGDTLEDKVRKSLPEGFSVEVVPMPSK